MLRVMPQSDASEQHDWKEPPKNWAEEQAHRTAMEIRRLRGKRSAQWLATRTAELGSEVTRSVISDLEIGRRRYVTTAELVVLALALGTAPLALLYPAPYRDKIRAFPGQPEVTKIWAAQWFSGSVDDLDLVEMPLVDQRKYHSHLLALERARKAFTLDERKQKLSARLAVRRRAKRDGHADVTDDEIDDMVAEIDDLQNRIDELWKLGSRDLDVKLVDQLSGGQGKGRRGGR
ncbi:hypothetical protein A9W99_02725 [Mycobacterium sp. 1164966.3]|nr:hypothetical protein A9W99_02725 [Mycobacterium sp. 1164966.3]